MNFLNKKMILSLALALLSVASWAATPGVTFLLNNGSKVSFAFSAKPIISVESDGITVSSQDQADVSYLFTEVQRFFIEDDVQAAVHNVKAEASVPVFSYKNGVVTVSGLEADEQVFVHSSDGRKVSEAKADGSGRAILDISHATIGVYVVSTSRGVSFKLLKK